MRVKLNNEYIDVYELFGELQDITLEHKFCNFFLNEENEIYDLTGEEQLTLAQLGYFRRDHNDPNCQPYELELVENNDNIFVIELLCGGNVIESISVFK